MKTLLLQLLILLICETALSQQITNEDNYVHVSNQDSCTGRWKAVSDDSFLELELKFDVKKKFEAGPAFFEVDVLLIKVNKLISDSSDLNRMFSQLIPALPVENTRSFQGIFIDPISKVHTNLLIDFAVVQKPTVQASSIDQSSVTQPERQATAFPLRKIVLTRADTESPVKIPGGND